jgi:hypothetical protein
VANGGKDGDDRCVCMCVWVVGEMVSLGEMEDLARGGDLLGNGLN